MYCNKCGNELKDGDAFCSKCGQSTEKKSTNKYIMIVIGVVIIVAFIIIAILVPKLIKNTQNEQIQQYKQEQETQQEVKNPTNDEVKSDIKRIKTGIKYINRVYENYYTNGYADSTIVFNDDNTMEFKTVLAMDYYMYTGKYTIEGNTVIANLQYADEYTGESDSVELKFDVIDENIIVSLDSGDKFIIQ